MTSAIKNPNPINLVQNRMHVYYFNPITDKIRDGYVMDTRTDSHGNELAGISDDRHDNVNMQLTYRPLAYMFKTIEGLTAELDKEIERQAENLASEIKTVEDLVTFAAYHDITSTENLAGIPRKAYVKKAKELLNLDLS